MVTTCNRAIPLLATYHPPRTLALVPCFHLSLLPFLFYAFLPYISISIYIYIYTYIHNCGLYFPFISTQSLSIFFRSQFAFRFFIKFTVNFAPLQFKTAGIDPIFTPSRFNQITEESLVRV